MRTGLYKVFAVWIISILNATLANAAPVLCSGTVNSVALQSNGVLLVAYGSYTLHTICNVSTTYAGMDKDTCKSWLAVIQSAKAREASIRLYYDNAVAGNPTSCSSISYAQGTSPCFIEVLN